MSTQLKAPFPYFGGKSTIADAVWARFGEVTNFVEPFFGSGAVLLQRPRPFEGLETVNDKDAFVSNFWRAVQWAPDEVARHADWPVNENDLHARHFWLVSQRESLQARIEGDPEFFDARIAGWWCWGMCCWIGGGFCSGDGPWRSVEVNGVRVLVKCSDGKPGVNRTRVHIGTHGIGVNKSTIRGFDDLRDWMRALAERLRHVRVCCGDWSRIMTPAATTRHGLTAVFLDPPYSAEAGRCNNLYARESHDVAHAVREWCLENGNNPELRIALCGYEGEHEMPADWECLEWLGPAGYCNEGQNRGKENRHRERIWFSPACLKAAERMLF